MDVELNFDKEHFLKLLKDKQITLKKLANVLNISQAYLNYKINSKRKFYLHDIKKILIFLDMKFEEVFK